MSFRFILFVFNCELSIVSTPTIVQSLNHAFTQHKRTRTRLLTRTHHIRPQMQLLALTLRVCIRVQAHIHIFYPTRSDNCPAPGPRFSRTESEGVWVPKHLPHAALRELGWAVAYLSPSLAPPLPV